MQIAEGWTPLVLSFCRSSGNTRFLSLPKGASVIGGFTKDPAHFMLDGQIHAMINFVVPSLGQAFILAGSGGFPKALLQSRYETGLYEKQFTVTAVGDSGMDWTLSAGPDFPKGVKDELTGARLYNLSRQDLVQEYLDLIGGKS
jgi:hypothetical protein